jgi:hypothetical protein
MEQGSLSVGDEFGFGSSPGTSARVRRRSGSEGAEDGLCADVGSSYAASESATNEGSSIDLSLFGTSEVLRTRCAGPLTSDVSSLLPVRSIDEAAVRRGGAKLDYSADGQFAAHGLAGTLHSNVVLTLRKGSDLLAQEGGGRTTNGKTRIRFLEVSYRVESVSGEVTASVHGLADPDLCGPLDSCGLLGTVTARPAASNGDGFAIAYAPAKKHSGRDLRRALGLVSGPVPRGVRRAAFFEWEDAGSVTSDLSRNGAPACNDSAPLMGGGLLDLRFSGGHATARYYSGQYNGGGSLLTRCPGPGVADAATGLARGTVALRRLGARRATLRLPRGAAFSSNGYRSSTTSSLAVSIRRVAVRERVESEPTGP